MQNGKERTNNGDMPETAKRYDVCEGVSESVIDTLVREKMNI